MNFAVRSTLSKDLTEIVLVALNPDTLPGA